MKWNENENENEMKWNQIKSNQNWMRWKQKWNELKKSEKEIKINKNYKVLFMKKIKERLYNVHKIRYGGRRPPYTFFLLNLP